MKAIRAHAFGGPDVLQADDIATPQPGSGEVLIEMRAAGVNPADTYMLGGSYAIRPDLPYTPGGDFAGVIAALGEDVTGWSAGDRVFVSAALGVSLTGGYADYVLRPAENLRPLPDGVSFEQAAALGVPYVTAHLGLFEKGRAARGETVFIHGASGAVGTAAIQLARRAGLTVIGSAGSAAGLDLIREQGVSLAVDHSSDTYLDAIRAATDGNGPDLILEMLADRNLAADMELAAKYGRIVIIGCRGDVTISPRLSMMKELTITGTAVWNAPRETVLGVLDDIAAGLADQSLAPVIGARFALDQAADAHRAVMEPGHRGKVVITR